MGRVRLCRRPGLERRTDSRPLLRRNGVDITRHHIDHGHGAVDASRRPADRSGVGARRCGLSHRNRHADGGMGGGGHGQGIGGGAATHRHLGQRRVCRSGRRVRTVGHRAVVSRHHSRGERHRRLEPHGERGAGRAVPAFGGGIGDVASLGGSWKSGIAGTGHCLSHLRTQREALQLRPHLRHALPVVSGGGLSHRRERSLPAQRMALDRCCRHRNRWCGAPSRFGVGTTRLHHVLIVIWWLQRLERARVSRGCRCWRCHPHQPVPLVDRHGHLHRCDQGMAEYRHLHGHHRGEALR